MKTRIKICGITRREDAQLAIALGAAALGFNFYPKSPRYIAPSAATEIIRRLPPFVTPVGVFADEPDSGQILAVAREAHVAAIQLRGPRLPDLKDFRENYSLIMTIPVGPTFQVADLDGLDASAYLLDSLDANLLGGTGKTFDWKLACQAARRFPVILAGGLTAENVAQAIREVRPFAVDVASGVESSPGIKDAAKLRAFIEAVKEADLAFSDLVIKQHKSLNH